MKILVLLSLVYLNFSTCDRILAFFPFPDKTHLSVIEPIIHGLAEKGHNLTYISRFKLKNHDYKVEEIIIDNVTDLKGNSTRPNLDKYVPSFVIAILDHLGYAIRNTLDAGILGLQNNEEIYSTSVFKELMKSHENFDLILFESIFNQEPQSALMHKFQAIGVDIQAKGDDSWINEISGLPSNPSFMVDYITSFTNQMNFWERFQNTFFINMAVLVHYLILEYIAQEQMDKHFVYPGSKNRPSLEFLVKDKALILTNTHFSIGYSYPKSSNVKEIGGINVVHGELPNDIKYFMDTAKYGAIYINLRNSSDNFTDLILEEFIKMPQKFLWKRKDNYTITSNNVIFSKKLPQNDILFHKNISAFITNGGYLDIIEAVYNAVPLIVIPMNGPELKNAEKISTEGYGIVIHPMNLTPLKFIKAIKLILKNPLYAKNAFKKSVIFRDRSIPPLDEAIYWIEYVLRNKNVLKPISTQMDYLQLHNLDVEFLFFILLTGLIFIARLVYLCIFPRREMHVKKQSRNSNQ